MTRPVFVTVTFCGPHDGGVTWPCMAVFFGVVHSQAKWPERPQLKQVGPEVAPAVGGAGRCNIGGGGVEPLVLPTGADAEVGGKPTATTDASAGAADEAGRRGRSGTPSGTLGEHY